VTGNEFTLVVTAHRRPFLAEALRSVCAQTDQGFDLVCCADVGNGPEALHGFRELWGLLACRRKRLLEVHGNGTAGRVRNAGFAAAQTEWVAYLDGDDYLRPDAVAQMRSAILAGRGRVRAYSSGLVRVHDDGREEPWPASLEYRPPLWIYETDPDTVGHPTFFNQLQAIRRRDWEDYPYDETTNGEDIDFMLHHLLAGRFAKVPEYLYYLRDTPGSFSKRAFEGGDLCSRRYRAGYYANLLRRHMSEEARDNFLAETVPPAAPGGP
jgi:glycosyltransferase involved in cell wall biosynthesis